MALTWANFWKNQKIWVANPHSWTFFADRCDAMIRVPQYNSCEVALHLNGVWRCSIWYVSYSLVEYPQRNLQITSGLKVDLYTYISPAIHLSSGKLSRLWGWALCALEMIERVERRVTGRYSCLMRVDPTSYLYSVRISLPTSSDLIIFDFRLRNFQTLVFSTASSC